MAICESFLCEICGHGVHGGVFCLTSDLVKLQKFSPAKVSHYNYVSLATRSFSELGLSSESNWGAEEHGGFLADIKTFLHCLQW